MGEARDEKVTEAIVPQYAQPLLSDSYMQELLVPLAPGVVAESRGA